MISDDFSRRITVCAITLVALGQLGISIYTPSLPPMTRALGATPSEIAGTLTTYLVTFGAAQLVLGPLSERLGRIPTMVASLIIFMLGAVCAGLSTTMQMLAAARLLQGFGAGGASAIARILLRDHFSGSRLQIALGQVSMGIVLIPLIAPILGGYIELFAGWRHQFTIMALAAAAGLWWCILHLQESTTPTQRATFRYRDIPGSYRALLTCREFLSYALLAASVYACTTVYYLSAPFIFQNQLGISPEVYGWLPIPTVLCYIIGTNVAITLNQRGAGSLCIPVGIGTMVVGSCTMVLTGQWPSSGASIVIPMALIMVGEGLVLPAAIGHALSQKAAAPGYTAAGVGGFQMLGSSAVSGWIGLIPEPTHQSLGLLLMVLSMGCIAIHVTTEKKNAFI